MYVIVYRSSKYLVEDYSSHFLFLLPLLNLFLIFSSTCIVTPHLESFL